MEDCRATIEERLDVDELPGPIFLAKDALAECKTVRARLLRVPGSDQVVRRGHAQHARPVMRAGGPGIEGARTVCPRRLSHSRPARPCHQP